MLHVLSLLAPACDNPQSEAQIRSALWASSASGYERRTKPTLAANIANGVESPLDANPDGVNVSMVALQLEEVVQVNQRLTLSAVVRARWIDSRASSLASEPATRRTDTVRV
jgi:hypothetical protein